MVDAVAVFFAAASQWRYVPVGMGGALRTGLDYPSLESVARLSGIEMTPGLFDDIRTLEREALSVWSRK